MDFPRRGFNGACARFPQIAPEVIEEEQKSLDQRQPHLDFEQTGPDIYDVHKDMKKRRRVPTVPQPLMRRKGSGRFACDRPEDPPYPSKRRRHAPSTICTLPSEGIVTGGDGQMQESDMPRDTGVNMSTGEKERIDDLTKMIEANMAVKKKFDSIKEYLETVPTSYLTDYASPKSALPPRVNLPVLRGIDHMLTRMRLQDLRQAPGDQVLRSWQLSKLHDNLQRLPQELFDQIFEDVFTAEPRRHYITQKYQADQARHTYFGRPLTTSEVFRPDPRLHVNRATREQFAASFYGPRSIFLVHCFRDLEEFLDSIPPAHRLLLSDVRWGLGPLWECLNDLNNARTMESIIKQLVARFGYEVIERVSAGLWRYGFDGPVSRNHMIHRNAQFSIDILRNLHLRPQSGYSQDTKIWRM